MVDDLDEYFASNNALRNMVKDSVRDALHDWEVQLLAELNEQKEDRHPQITRQTLVKSVVFLASLRRTWGFVDRKGWMMAVVLTGMAFITLVILRARELIELAGKKIGL